MFEDLNGNQRWEPNAPHNEPGLECFDIYIDLDRDGVRSAGEPSTRTGADGSYRFDNLNPGDYSVDLVADSGYDRTTSIRFGNSTQLISSSPRDHVFDPVRNVLYVTSGDRVLRRDPQTGNTLAALAIGTSLTGLDITPDGKYLLVGEGTVDTNSQTGSLYKIDLENDTVSTISFSITGAESGVFDIVAVNNGRAFFTTSATTSSHVPLREINLNSDVVTPRTDAFPGGAGLIRPSSRLDRNASRSSAVLVEAGGANGTIYQYDPVTNTFPRSRSLNAALDQAHVSISRDGKLIAVESAGAGLVILNDQLADVQTLTHFRGGVAFDSARDILYAGDTTNDQLVALNSNTWAELYRQSVGEDLLDAGTYAEMQISLRAKYLSFTTPNGVRYIQLDRALPINVSVAANQVVQDIDFGYWWNGANRRPRAMPDNYAVNEDTTLNVFAAGVLTNDEDADGNALTLVQQSPTVHGQLLTHADGSFSYTPNADYVGSDQFTYFVRDAALQSCRAATVMVNVQAVNDAPSNISLSNSSVNENAAAATIGTVVVTDVDTADQHSFVLSDGRFEVANGLLKLKSGVQLNYETAASIVLTITATDNGSPAKNYIKTFTIQVNDVNEFDPVVETTSLDVNENATTIGKVNFKDSDSAQVPTIQIQAGNSGGIFSIDAQSGVISVVSGKQLDFEASSSYQLTVRVTDNGQPSRSTTQNVSIQVADVNEFDPSIGAQSFSIAENAAGGSVIGKVVASDQDSSQVLSYAITSGNVADAFTINASTGEIKLANNAQLDFETTSSFQLTVTATDNVAPARSVSATITVNVTNVNEFNPSIDPQTLLVQENSLAGTMVGTVLADDGDGSGSLQFAITGGNSGGIFSIDAVTGAISVAKSDTLDFESQKQYLLTIRATDTGPQARTTTGSVTIQVTDVNEYSPEIDNGSFTVPENSTFIGTIHAEDTEHGDPVSLHLFGSTADLFEVSETGEISVVPGKKIDFEQYQYHLLSVSATDTGSPAQTSFATVEIFVTDVNEFSPTLAPQQVFELPENPATGYPVGIIVASDQDVQQQLFFQITGGNADGIFAIDAMTGHLSAMNTSFIDRERTSRYDLTIQVTDDGNPNRSSTGIITVFIGDHNEFPPNIEDQTFTLHENAAEETLVGTVGITDLDGSVSFTIRITAGSSAFDIDSLGSIRVVDSSTLDFETNPIHRITVEVSDTNQPNLRDSATITILLTDENEFDPIVPEQRFTLTETATNGTVVGTVTATDSDVFQKISYSIVDGNDGNVFAINSTTGQITVANRDALPQSTTEYLLTVRATDNGSPQRSGTGEITIEYNTDNPNAPLINNQSFEIDENVPTGTFVGVVLAIDLDGHSLTYAITGGNAGGAFEIDSDSGTLTVANAAAVDFETNPVFRLNVQVTDSGRPPRVSSATVTIHVRDVNDPPIAITLDNNTVRRHIVAALVGHVSVRDQDVNDQHTLTVDDSRFEINSSRELKLAPGVALGNSDGPDIPINITATDLAGASLTQPFVIHVIGNSVGNNNPWQNPKNRYDVSDDGAVAPIDALLIINEINNPQYSDSSGQLQLPRPDIPGLPYYDVNGDGFVTAIDVLIIVNRLNNPSAESSTGGEGESASDSTFDQMPGRMSNLVQSPSPSFDFASPLFVSTTRTSPLVHAASGRGARDSSSVRPALWLVSSQPNSSTSQAGLFASSARRQATASASNSFESALDEIAEEIADRWDSA